MIVTKIMGGLGNQLFQYATGFAVASHWNEPLVLDTSFYSTQSLRSFSLDKFGVYERVANVEERRRLKGIEWGLLTAVLDRLDVEWFRPASYIKERVRTVFDERVFARRNVYLDGYWQNEKYFKSVRDDLLTRLGPSRPIRSELTDILDAISSRCSVSLHVRRGDYLKHPEIGVLDLEYYRSAILHLTERARDPVFFVFSDDRKWCEQNLSFVQDMVIVDKTVDEVEDLYLMSRCLHNITANSSFSWWGAWLNPNTSKIVISPKKWMASAPRAHKWVPDEWIQI